MLAGLYEIREMARTKKHFIFNMVHIKSLSFFTSPRCISVTRAPRIGFSLDFNFYKDSSHHVMSIKAYSKKAPQKKWMKVSTSLEWSLLREFLTIYHLPTLTFARLVDLDILSESEALDNINL